ncbi:MAG TPA: transglycosylase SLT domain-containing protein [Burkholderiaceae bacterium]|nr:transglycosylase SLT domain-containing protein [Burkholderiaceae bacterium]
MLFKKYLVVVTLALTAFGVAAPVARAQAAAATPAADEAFLALREASRKRDLGKVEALAARLQDYDIPSYVDYYRLKPRIADFPDTEIRAYLTRYDGTAIADRLRNDWLLELGRVRNWGTFDEQFPLFALQDDTQLKCYALMSLAAKGQNAAEQARALLDTPKDYGEGCVALIATLAQNGQFSQADLWAQVRLASEANYLAIAKRVAALAGASDKLIAEAFDKPALTLARGVSHGAGRGVAGQLYVIALGRVARNNPQQAADALQAEASRLSAADQALGWAQIALQAALKLAPEASDYWRRAKDAPLSADGYQWRVRSALRDGDWKLVKAGIDAMPPALRNDPSWVYWDGRALQHEGKGEQAEARFAAIAERTGFYGQLAREELGHELLPPLRPTPPSADEVAPMAQNQGFRRALRFFDMGLRFEGVREWNWELRQMDERQHLAAAEFARQKDVLDRMVNTSDRTRVEVDFTQRFPTPFRSVMLANTQALGLDMAWVYGLIRQESRFIMHARSHVGASGLMQLMPATARLVARQIGFNGFNPSQVNEIDTNILLGTNYLSMVLGQLDGSQTLASAAYNAGPGRPRAWRSTLKGPVEGAIFAESIPFAETRGYVKNVLSNATWYAALFENRAQSLKARLGTVTP